MAIYIRQQRNDTMIDRCDSCGIRRSVKPYYNSGSCYCRPCTKRANMYWAQNIIQPLAIEQIYAKAFPDATVRENDREAYSNELARTLDMVSGVDKILSFPTYHVNVGQRFRHFWHEDGERIVYEYWPQFTLRESEMGRYRDALANGGIIPALYAYGYANESDDGFGHFYIVRFKDWLTYHESPSTVNQHKMGFFDRSSDRENNFYYLDWRNIPKRFFALDWHGGDIEPVKIGGTIPQPTQLWLSMD